MKKLVNYFFNMKTSNVLLIVTGIGLITGLSSLVMSLLKGPTDLYGWIEEGLLNFSTGMFQALIIYLLIEMVIGTREKKEAEKRAEDLRNEEVTKRRMEQQITVITELKASTTHEARQLILDKMKKLGLFCGANLQQTDLQEADLQGADLKEVDLRKANLVGANLQGANMAYGDLQEAVLIRANLQEANLESANLREAQLSEATFHQARLQKANLQRANLQKARLTKASLQDAILQGTNLSESNLHKSSLRAANLQWADLSGARLFEADIRETNLRGAQFNIYTTLPDGTQWSVDTDWKKFVDLSSEL